MALTATATRTTIGEVHQLLEVTRTISIGQLEEEEVDLDEEEAKKKGKEQGGDVEMGDAEKDKADADGDEKNEKKPKDVPNRNILRDNLRVTYSHFQNGREKLAALHEYLSAPPLEQNQVVT